MFSKSLKHTAIAVLLLTSLFFLFSCSGNPNGKITPPQDLIGNWYGTGQHSLAEDILGQKDIDFALIIGKDGSLEGTVGDADIAKSELAESPFYLKLVGKEKYRSNFDLIGKIVNNENFSRLNGSIYIKKISPNELICSFVSSGNNNKSDNMIMTISTITMSHSDPDNESDSQTVD